MVLDFPGYLSIFQAISSGLIPEDAISKATRYEQVDEGRVLVHTDASLSRAATKGLSAIGVRKRRISEKNLTRSASCWMEMLPLLSNEPEAGEKTAVLFELTAGESVSELVSEILRLGNDRQSFRVITEEDESRVLLRVVGPPYYSLLRALDRKLSSVDGDADDDGHAFRNDLLLEPGCKSSSKLNGRVTAYLERAPRVWIEIGSTHLLASQLKPPAGRMLLISKFAPWRVLPEAPFQDIYNALDLELPDQPVDLADAELDSKLRVPLRLVRGGSDDVAELWVLDGAASDQLDEFVRTSDARLIARLSFAVAKNDDSTTIILRLRPSRDTPPVLVLDALACESYLKLPNLFVPAGHRIHPPLRRDVVKNLLADSPAMITWLEPASGNREPQGASGRQTNTRDDGGFVPRRVPDTAFRPLEDWVDYVLDREHEALEAWMQSSRFDFESFICPDEQPDRKPKKKQPEKRDRPDRDSSTQEEGTEQTGGTIQKVVQKVRGRRKQAKKATQSRRRPPAELEKQLRKLEAAFIEFDAPLDAPERESMWADLARTNSALKLNTEAGICWTHTFWEQPSVEDADPDQVEEWFEVESFQWSHRDGLINEDDVDVTLDRLLASSNPTPLELNTLASWLVIQTSEESPSPAIASRLGKLQHHLERFEPMLPIRTAWLAWCAYVNLSHGDVLALARARDRLLERLFQHGLMPDRDVPSFLRARGMQSGDRFRAVRDQIVDLRPAAKKWSKKHRKTAADTTDQYIDLIFAFALGRLGESTAGKDLLAEVTESLGEKDAIHNWAVSAYGYRVQQAVEGRAANDTLPNEVMEKLDAMGRLDRYKLDRLRQHSNVLEPHEKIDPFRRWHQRFSDELSEELAKLVDTRDRDELTQHMTRLLNEVSEPAQRRKVVTTALEVGPRLGEVIAKEILDETFEMLDETSDDDVLDTAMLLEGGLFLAAHFDQSEAVASLVERLHGLLESQSSDDQVDVESIQTLQALLTQSFRGMRKLGMRDNIARLLDQMAALVRSAEKKLATSAKKTGGEDRASLLTAMLQVASGWFFFGQNESAWAVLDEVRDLLFSAELAAVPQKKLACAYAAALGQAPVDEAMPRFTEMFKKLKGIQDSFTTNTHFSLSHLDLIEAVLLAMVSDDFTMNEAGRRWLDDDEFLIRRRIHRDVREAMKQEA